MKSLTLALLLLTSSAFAQEMHHHEGPAVHGMLVVGKSKIYLSHLPMFHAPHDYQVILEVQVSDSAKQAYLKSLQNSRETVYTLAPEPFGLPEMVQHPKTFTATVYRGHFERGGTVIATSVKVDITKVIYFKKFDPSAVHNFDRYILFGNQDEQFLAHEIVAKPDFDQLLSVNVGPSLAIVLTKTPALPVSFVEAPSPLPASGSFRGTIGQIKIQSSLYLETGDLSF